MPSSPAPAASTQLPEPAPPQTDDEDRPTWSQIDVDELMHGPRPESLPPGSSVDAVQSYQIGQIARAQAAIGESIKALRNRVELLEEAAVRASERAGKRGARTSLTVAIVALLTAIAQVLPEAIKLLQ
jgi:hypothetical protein